MAIRVPPLVLRLEKQSPLTAQEGDDNLKKLRDAINAAFALLDISLNPDGSLKRPPIVFGESTTNNDSYVIAPDQEITTPADLLGRIIVFKADVANAGPATLTVSELPAAPIKKFKDQNLESMDIKAGQVVFVSWDGTYYQMESFPGVVQPINYANDTGTTENIYAVVQSVDPTTSPTAVHIPEVLYPGYAITFKARAKNTSSAKLKVGAHPEKELRRDATEQLTGGEISAEMLVTAIYDGASFQVTSRSATKNTGIPVYIPEKWVVVNLTTVNDDWVVVDCASKMGTDAPGTFNAVILRIVAGIRESDNTVRQVDPPPEPPATPTYEMSGGQLLLRVDVDTPVVKAFNAATNPSSATGQHLASLILTFPVKDKKFQYKVDAKFSGVVTTGQAGMNIYIVGYIV